MTTQKEKGKTWTNIFIFLAIEWFGEEFAEEFMNYKWEGDPIGEGEKIIKVDLDDHEKFFWTLVHCLSSYLRKNRKKLPSGEWEEKVRMSEGLKSQFWAMIRLNHPEMSEPDIIGIRKGFVIVQLPSPPPANNPLYELLKKGFPIS